MKSLYNYIGRVWKVKCWHKCGDSERKVAGFGQINSKQFQRASNDETDIASNLNTKYITMLLLMKWI